MAHSFSTLHLLAVTCLSSEEQVGEFGHVGKNHVLNFLTQGNATIPPHPACSPASRVVC